MARLVRQDEQAGSSKADNQTKEDPQREEGKAAKAEETKTADGKTETKKAEPSALEQKTAEAEEWRKKYLTSLADMQNLRTRTQNDVNAAKKYAGGEFAKSMLEVADNLAMALKAAEADATDANPKLKTFYEGVAMTQSTMIKAFGTNGVVMYTSLGQKFDPNLHMALYQMEDPNKEPGTVGNVVKEGYKLADRVLRAAQVGTVKARAASSSVAEGSKKDQQSMEQQQRENVKLDIKTYNQNTPGSETTNQNANDQSKGS